jgi:hypothetical protein
MDDAEASDAEKWSELKVPGSAGISSQAGGSKGAATLTERSIGQSWVYLSITSVSVFI